MKKQSLALLLSIILLSAPLIAQNKDLLRQTLPLASGKYSLEEVLGRMGNLKVVNLTYNAKELPLQQKLKIIKNNPTLQEVLNQIVKETPVDYQILNKYIILKKKKLASSYTISGQVTDSATGGPMVGVNVYLKKNLTGTVTDNRGKYSISVPPGNYILVFSFVGYSQKEIPVNVYDDVTVNASLAATNTSIEEIKITGQRKFFGNMDYGRDIPTIEAKVIESQNENNASDILHARIAGVWATKTSGMPGDHEKIRIRGQNSFFSSAEPLYVVDGVPVPIVNLSSLGIADLNIHDIASVTILKDASSTALYGFQGGNGVVLIDTKQGGQNEISFINKLGIQKFDHFYDLMNSKDFITSLNDANKAFGSFIRDYYPKLTDHYSDDNWQKEIFRTGFVHEHQLAASGTKGKTNYYFSGNYTDQDGILPNSNYKRYTLSAKAGRVFWKKLAIQAGYRGSVQKNKNNQDLYKGNPLLFQGISQAPCIRDTPDSLTYNPLHDLNPRIYYMYDGLKFPVLPQELINNIKNSLGITSHIISGSAKLQITDHLSLNAMESLMLRYSKYDYQNYGIIIKSSEDVFLYNHQYSLSYFNTFGKHKVDLTAAYRLYKDNLWWHVDTMQGHLDAYSYLRNSMAAYGPDGSVIRTLSSYVTNASYNYNETYFLSLVANVSHIKEGIHIHYYALFPSVAASWDVAQVKPLKNLRWLDYLKLYANWGISGNYPLNGLANDLYENVDYTYGTTTGTAPAVLQFANHFLKHESTSETDYGLKTSLFNNRIDLSVVYFIKNIGNLIIKRAIPQYYQGGEIYLNLGRIHIPGEEFSLNATPVETKDFYWDFGFNFSASHQTIEKLAEGTSLTFLQSTDEPLMPEFIIKKGDAMGNLYGYQTLGKWTKADNAAHNKLYVDRGQLKFLNADTTSSLLNINDAVVLGNSVPDFTWNLFNTFHYKNFTLDMVWYAVAGVQKFNLTRGATLMTGTNRDVYTYLNDSIGPMTAFEFYRSSDMVENAGFIRLKTLTLTYEPAGELIRHVSLKFSLGFENLLTITKYKGYDPEATTFTDNNFSDNAIDRGAVPNPKAVYATITMNIK